MEPSLVPIQALKTDKRHAPVGGIRTCFIHMILSVARPAFHDCFGGGIDIIIMIGHMSSHIGLSVVRKINHSYPMSRGNRA